MFGILNSALQFLGAIVVDRPRYSFGSLLLRYLGGLCISGLIHSILVVRNGSRGLPGSVIIQDGRIDGKVVSKNISLLKQFFGIVIEGYFV